MAPRLGEVSHWYHAMGGVPARRGGLNGDSRVDICIIGAGFTGLWAAYYLKTLDPGLNILIIDRAFAGYGASGRNGGWLTGGFAWDASRYGPDVGRFAAALRGTVDEVITVAETHGIDADIHRTEELTVAFNRGQARRMAADLRTRQALGAPDYAIDADAVAGRIDLPGAVGALVTPGVARIQPAKLVQGLAQVVIAQGVQIAEGVTATRLSPGRVDTDQGAITAGTILRATEGYTPSLAKREWLPLNSAQVVTEPLPPEMWRRIGWRNAELFGDMSEVYCYCQRTADGRIAVGSRGVPYRFGSRTDTDGAPDPVTVQRLTTILHRYFPAARGVGIAHAWCGVLGVPRDWCATVGFDPQTRIGWAGGYVGVGVSTSNLAGRSLADLTLGRDTDLTRLAWVNRKVRQWEPEPLRWLGVRGAYGAKHLRDAWERLWG